MYQFDILSCAPTNITLRDVQKKALLWFQENYDKSDVLLMNIPVAGGKSIVAMTACEWMKQNGLGNAATVTPTKILMDQYTNDFSWIPSLKGMDSYPCAVTDANNCKSTKRIFGKCCGQTCSYLSTKSACTSAPVSIYNVHSYIHNEMWKKNVCYDEGHNISSIIFDMHTVRLWAPEWKFDPEMEATHENVIKVMEMALQTMNELHAIALGKKIEAQIEELETEINKYTSALSMLQSFGDDVLIVKKEEPYTGKIAKSLKGTKQILIDIKPLKVSSLAANILWPEDRTDKIVLLSATIGKNDIHELGLSNRRVAYFESESQIPKERRPFAVIPVAKMSRDHQEESIPIIAEYLKKLALKHHTEKGLVHCTYKVAEKLRLILGKDPRFLFHDNFTKTQVYLDFRNKPGNQILVGSGMSEGIDLANDSARWQVITKCQYPYLGDDVWAWRKANEPELYIWATIRTIIQQSGRIVRNETDYGTTYMLDTDFKRLWEENRSMFPKWFREAVVLIR